MRWVRALTDFLSLPKSCADNRTHSSISAEEHPVLNYDLKHIPISASEHHTILKSFKIRLLITVRVAWCIKTNEPDSRK